MDLFEYQGKELLAAAGIPVLPARLARTPQEAERAAAELGLPVAVKAQVLSGGRGKAGGVRLVGRAEDVAAETAEVLGLKIGGSSVSAVLVEQGITVLREFYLAVTLDRSRRRPLLIFSTAGGMDIEQVARERPDQVSRLHLDPLYGPLPEQVSSLVALCALEEGEISRQLTNMIGRVWRLYRDRDATLVEVNPLAVVRVRGGESLPRVVALDAKVSIDDNGLVRQPDVAALRREEDSRERAARAAGFTYLTLDGDIGVLGNGAGLVMSSLDLLHAAGGRGADFCDIGAGASAERITAALDIVSSDDRVRALLINVFGGITRGDEVARGILAWRRATAVDSRDVPAVVRLDGNQAAEGRAMLEAAGMPAMVTVETMMEAVRQVVAIASGARA